MPSVLGIEYTLSKTVLGKSAVISENQTATSDGERGMPSSSALLSLSVYRINLKCRILDLRSLYDHLPLCQAHTPYQWEYSIRYHLMKGLYGLPQ